MTRARFSKITTTRILHHNRIVIGCALLLSVAAIMTARSRSPQTENVAAPGGSATHSATALSSLVIAASDRLPRLLITLRPTGFDPSETSLSDGRFLLAVDNKTGLDAVVLRLTREGDTRETRWSLEGAKLREKVSLPAGTYVLTEAAHSEWRCRLTILH